MQRSNFWLVIPLVFSVSEGFAVQKSKRPPAKKSKAKVVRENALPSYAAAGTPAPLVNKVPFEEAEGGFRAYSRLALTTHSALRPIISVGAGLEKEISENLYVGGRVDYWQYDENNFVKIFNITQKVQDLSFGSICRYVFRIGKFPLRPYAGGGLAYHRISDTFMGRETVKHSIGLDASGGVDWQFSGSWIVQGGLNIRLVDTYDYRELSGGLGRIF